jgi:hypothetical protein
MIRLSIVHLCDFSILMMSTNRSGVINGCTFRRFLLPTGRPLCFGLDGALFSELSLCFDDRVSLSIGLFVDGEDAGTEDNGDGEHRLGVPMDTRIIWGVARSAPMASETRDCTFSTFMFSNTPKRH